MLSNIYLQSDKQISYEELISDGEVNANFIGGDLNKAKTGMSIHSNIYHIHNL